MWVLKVKVISWPWPKVSYIWNLKLAFLRNHLANQNQILYVSFQVQGNENLLTWWWSHYQDGPQCPYMVKNPSKNLPLRNRWTDFHETWYVAWMTPAHHSLFKWWSWVDLDLFYDKVKFGNIVFSIGKCENCWFFRTFAACDLKTNWKNEICEHWRSRTFLDLGPRSFTYKT